MGKKTKYNDDFPLLVEGYLREGLTDEQVAAKLGIKKTAFYDYQKKYPEFAEAIKKGKAPVDIQVENALLKRALGYEYEEEIEEIRYDSNGKEHKTIRKIKKHMPPDTTAIFFWLVNRKGDKWRSINKEYINNNRPQTADFKFEPIDESIINNNGNSSSN